MSPLAYHLILRLLDNRVIITTPSKRAILIQTINKLSLQRKLLAWRMADTHLHLLIVNNRREAGEFARVVEMALKRRLDLDIGFSPAYIKQIHGQQHFIKTFFYILGQGQHHKILNDPFHEASNVLDIIGLRTINSHAATLVNQYLPRVNKEAVLNLLNINLDKTIKDFSVLRAATASVVGVDKFHKRVDSEIDVRAAAIKIVGNKLPVSTLAKQLDVSQRTIYRLKKRQANPMIIEALKSQLKMRQEFDQSLTAR